MKKIVFVEDDAKLLDAFTRKLEQNGFEVYTANDGLQGYNVIKRVHPDLIVLDVLMPNMSGLELFSEYILKEFDDIPTIFLTNVDNARQAKLVMNQGAMGYYVKARTSLSELVNKIQTMLEEVEKER